MVYGWVRVHTACSSVHSPTMKTTWEPLEMALFLMESGWSLRPTGYSLPGLSSFVSIEHHQARRRAQIGQAYLLGVARRRTHRRRDPR